MPFPALALIAAKVVGGGGAATGAGAAKGGAAATGGGGVISKLMSMGGSGGGGGGKENKPDYFDVNLGPWHDPKLKPGAPQANVNPPLQKHVPPPAHQAQSPELMKPRPSPVDGINLGMQSLELDALNAGGFDFDAHRERMLSTGPHADAAARHQVWAPQVTMNQNAQDQMDNLNAGVLPGQRGAVQPQSKLSTAPAGNLPQGEALSPEQLRQKNQSLDAVEQKLGLSKKNLPTEYTPEQLKKLGL